MSATRLACSRSPGFTLVAVASLAIGIGANTAMYNVVRALLIESLPVTRPDELALAYWTRPASTKVRMLELNSDGFRDPKSGQRLQSNLTYSMFAAMRDASSASLPIFGFNFIGQANVSIDGQPPMPAGGMLATSEYFPVMGLAMAAGRHFTLYRRSTRRRTCRHQLRAVDAGVRRRPLGDRPDDSCGRHSVRGHRRHGAGLSRPLPGRVLSAGGRDATNGRAT
jgi:hypothetical protein